MSHVMYTDAELDALAIRIKHHAAKADESGKKWEHEKARLERWFAAHDGTRNPYNDDQRRQKMKVDWGMNDAMDSWSWHQREQVRLGELIKVEESLRLMRRLKEADEYANR